MLVGAFHTAVQIVSNLVHTFPSQRLLIITHSNQALNDVFEKLMTRHIDERYLLRLGHGEELLETEKDFSRLGRVNHMLTRRLELLVKVERLATSLEVAADVGYVPNPKEALVQTQVAIAAQTGFLGSQDAGNDNLFTIRQDVFKDQVALIINNGRYPKDSPITPGEPTKPAVLEIFTEFLGLDGQTDAEKMDSIENYLWGNVLRMRENNFYITDAPGRPVMPQTSRSTFQPVLGLMQGPSPLSYSFPIISYLG